MTTTSYWISAVASVTLTSSTNIVAVPPEERRVIPTCTRRSTAGLVSQFCR
jgi:hypothetical protein